MANIGFDLSEFDNLIKQFEQMGGDVEELSQKVINSATRIGMEAYRSNVPFGKRPNSQGHARDNLKLSPLKKGKNGARYKVISFKGDRAYLYMLDNGTSKILPKPWREKAKYAVRNATLPIMRDTLIKEINKYLGE